MAGHWLIIYWHLTTLFTVVSTSSLHLPTFSSVTHCLHLSLVNIYTNTFFIPIQIGCFFWGIYWSLYISQWNIQHLKLVTNDITKVWFEHTFINNIYSTVGHVHYCYLPTHILNCSLDLASKRVQTAISRTAMSPANYYFYIIKEQK